MAVSFSRTLQALQGDRPAWRFAGLSLLVVFPALLGWLFFAEITVYEVSTSARLESVPQNVAAEVEGKVVERTLQIGLEVTKGQVLVRLDDQHTRNLMAESQNQIDGAKMHIKALQDEIKINEESLASLATARELAVAEAREVLEAATIASQLAQQNLVRTETLAKTRAIAGEELEQKQAEAKTARATLRGAELKVERVAQEHIAKQFIQKAELESIRTELVTVEGQMANFKQQYETRSDELEQRTIQANVAGRIEEVVPFRLGDVVRPAEKLATIVPRETPQVVAFLPVIAVGRVETGQSGRLRMDGFPWTQYGTVAATVTAVGNEPADGLIRVELNITDPASRIPLKHGQTASVEIAVERASPAMLVLRAAGELLMTRRAISGSQ